jgi:hypothetical protein
VAKGERIAIVAQKQHSTSLHSGAVRGGKMMR